MPELENAGWEAFAHARALPLNMTEAYATAGYKPSRGAASRLNKKPAVAARLAELLIQREVLREARLEETIVALLALATAADLKTAAGAKEARTARLEAHRLSGLLAERREAETWTAPRAMTKAEWVATYGRDAPQPA